MTRIPGVLVLELVGVVLVVEVVEDTMEEKQMGIRTKKSWRSTILEPDDGSDLKQTNAQKSLAGLR